MQNLNLLLCYRAVWFLSLSFGVAVRAADGPQAAAPPDTAALDQYLEQRFKAENLPSLSVGIVHGDKLVYAKSWGVADRKTNQPATPETLYRIGSITKVFTTTLLAVLRDRGDVRLDDPISQFLPPDVKLPSDSRGAPAITLRHLATHTSGLPNMPANFVIRYAADGKGYDEKKLLDALREIKLESPIGARCQYSNLGMGLLGHILERKAGEPYEALLQKYICGPLEMKRTVAVLTPELRPAAATGYRDPNATDGMLDFDLGPLAPAGQLASSITDLAKFVSLQFRAGMADAGPVAGGTLAELHRPQRLLNGWGGAVGLGWHVLPDDEIGDIVWHNGNMDGFHCSYLSFSPTHKIGVIVLTNCGRSVDAAGRWLQREAVKTFGAKSDPALTKMAEALAGHFAAEPADALGDLFHAKFLAAVPLPRIKATFKGTFEELGKCEGFTVQPGEKPRAGTILFKFAGGKTLRGQIALDDGEPAKIVGLMLQPGR